MHGLPPPGQLLLDGHLEEVVGHVRAVLVQLELASQIHDVPLAWGMEESIKVIAQEWSQNWRKKN